MERNRNIWPGYKIVGANAGLRVADLRPWHALFVTCVACGHRGLVYPRDIEAKLSHRARLNRVASRLACRRCGRRGADWTIVQLPRD